MELTRWAVSTVGVQTGEQPENPKKKKDEKKEEASEPVNEIPAPESEEKYSPDNHKNHLPRNMF